ncbi:polysaccharide biosynthesis/export family protein [Sphingobium yanoikuyae]|jgi:polysaccharide export outer membrane protein|uniref:Polysaccharide export protein n=1 Tax=Sphingobium yanoikuyae TaxID=13690 RepID=A0A2D1QYF1_SPHYA|nr:polysaccharide biosynthesis/export family protein [Sphingobium yanoikuyae]ATP17595.1 hypothetical protein BV87_03780 [Sphingobium yanoikuyae]
MGHYLYAVLSMHHSGRPLGCSTHYSLLALLDFGTGSVVKSGAFAVNLAGIWYRPAFMANGICDFMMRKNSAVRLIVMASATLGGCTTLPSNGPTAGEVIKSVERNDSGLGIRLIDFSHASMQSLTSTPLAASTGFEDLRREGAADSPEIVRPGDTLSISIYEVGVSLFSAQSAAGGDLQVSNPVANAQRMSGVQVDENGDIQLPYIGTISASGLTPRAIEQIVEQKLRGLSQSPRAVISITDSVNGTVYMSGVVRRPGRYRLSVAHEQLRGYLAIAGGVDGDPSDVIVKLTRSGVTREMRLSDVQIGSPNDVRLLPGDQMEFLQRPRTYTVFGASDRISQVPFTSETLSLAEAIARVGGPSDARANSRGVFLFRMVSEGPDKPARPTIYRLNLMKPATYFLAQQVAMQDKDLIYFANSVSGPPTKLIGIINQLFGPFVTARALTQ